MSHDEQPLARVAVIGQGYVGLPLAVAAAEAGHRVAGLDHDPARVRALNAAQSPVPDISDERLAPLLADGRYVAHTGFGPVDGADVVVLCVPTPYRGDAPDLSYVEDAATRLAPRLRPGCLVVLESTSYPGTTDELLAPLLVAGSGLEPGMQFDVAFSPERIDPGNTAFGLRNTPKIVGGTTARATERAAAFYRTFVDRVVPVSSARAAEMAKLLENTFRHINIALVNELAVLCQDLSVDVWEVIEAAATKPFGFMPFYPGPGVGGHCIPIDPMYLSWRVRQMGTAARFIELAREVNSGMPQYCVERVAELLQARGSSLVDADVLVLGVGYKRDLGDLRESPALVVLQELRGSGAVVRYHDPYVPELVLDDGAQLKSVDLDAHGLAQAACVLVLTDHRCVDYDEVVRHASLIFDTRNVVPRAPHVHRL